MQGIQKNKISKEREDLNLRIKPGRIFLVYNGEVKWVRVEEVYTLNNDIAFNVKALDTYDEFFGCFYSNGGYKIHLSKDNIR